MDKTRYVLVDHGDGYFVYEDNIYIGKNDQVDPWRLLVESGSARKVDMPTDWGDEWGANAMDRLPEDL